MLGCGAASAQSWTISLGTCSVSNLNNPSGVQANCGWSAYTYFDNIRFSANANCLASCTSQGLSTSLGLRVGQNTGKPCPVPVDFFFSADVYTGSHAMSGMPYYGAPYLGILMGASDEFGSISQKTMIDCNKTPAYVGPPDTGDFPC